MHTTNEYEKAYWHICKLLGAFGIYVDAYSHYLYIISRDISNLNEYLTVNGSKIYLAYYETFFKLDPKVQHRVLVDSILNTLQDSSIGLMTSYYESEDKLPKGLTFEQLLIGDDLKIS